MTMTKEEAIATDAIVVPSVLNLSEISQLKALYDTIRAEEEENALKKGPLDSEANEFFHHLALDGLRSTNHVSVFVHVQQRMFREFPAIYSKIIEVMAKVDREQGWNLLADKPDTNVRVMEYHSYTCGGSVCDPTHCDGGSLVTSSILLSHPDDFTGGQFTCLESDRSTVTTFDEIRQGDAIVFVSEKYHSVEEVKSGNRRSFVSELWAGPLCVEGRDS